MKKKFLILLIVFFGCLYNLSAYINIPPSPDSISNENFTYNASYKTTDLGNYFFGIIKIESNSAQKYSISADGQEVFESDKDIEIVPKVGYKDFYIQVDGRKEVINDVKKIEIKISDKTIKCLRMKDYHFIKIVNDKLLEK